MFLSYIAIVFFAVGFLVFTWKYFDLAVGALIIFFPTYLIRLSLGPLPSTILELAFGIIFLVWLIRYAKDGVGDIYEIIQKNKIFFILLLIFLASSIVGVFVSDMPLKSLGQWRAYFLEPILLFFILLSEQKKNSPQKIILFLGLSSLSITLYSVFQAVTGVGIATPEWTNLATRRVTAFYTSPNAVGLYVAPLTTLIFFMLFRQEYKLKNKLEINKNFFRSKNTVLYLPLILLGFAAILFSKSEGAIAALLVGFALMFFLLGYKKLVIGIMTLGMLLAFLIAPVRRAVLFQDQSGKNRLTLWSYTWNYVTQSPENFIEGAGIRQFFRKIQKPYYDVKKMERLIYPHNILLNFWSEIGLFGMISFAGMFGYVFYLGIRILKNNLFLGAALLSCLLIIFVQGMVDVPYFKNDLAMLFWIIISLFFHLPQNYTAVEVEK
jgi:O-antigen ligase